MDKIGVIHGRFQILHKDHLEYILAGKSRCEYLLIGIANPDRRLTNYNSADPHRSMEVANPLTFFERFQMIQGTLLESGLKREEFDIVPFPINFPELLFNYVPKSARFYMTIYDAWGEEKKNLLESMGCSVDVMWKRRIEEKRITATEVRSRIARSMPWTDLVPPFVASYIMENQIDERIKKITARKDSVC